MRSLPTIAASPRTPRASRIPLASTTPNDSSRPPTGCAGEVCFVITLDDTLIGACAVDPREDGPEIGYWLGAPYWGQGFATEAVRAVIDHAFGDLQHEALQAGARVSNPASRRVLEKCAFQWAGVRLSRIRAINSAAPVDRFRLDRKLWVSLKRWGPVRCVA